MIVNKKNIFLSWFFVFLWLGVIYYFSDQPNLKSDFQPFLDLIFRKIAHLSEFFVLAYLIYKANYNLGFKNKQALALSALGVISCAFFDEYHQSFITGRQASVIDVVIDSFGGLIFCLSQYFYKK